MKQNFIEIILSIVILIIFVLSFSYAMDTFTGRTFVQSIIILTRDLTLNDITFYVTFLFLVLSGSVLLYPNKDAINSVLTKVLSPLVNRVFLVIINGKLMIDKERVKHDNRKKILIRFNKRFTIDDFRIKIWKVSLYSENNCVCWTIDNDLGLHLINHKIKIDDCKLTLGKIVLYFKNSYLYWRKKDDSRS